MTLDGGRYYACALFAQQAAEKAQKGLYVEQLLRVPPRTHSLVVLSEHLQMPKEFEDDLGLLTPAYIGSRYPDVVQGRIPFELYDQEHAAACLAAAERILKWVETQL